MAALASLEFLPQQPPVFRLHGHGAGGPLQLPSEAHAVAGGAAVPGGCGAGSAPAAGQRGGEVVGGVGSFRAGRDY